MQLNERAQAVARQLGDRADELRIAVHRQPNGATIVDCGVKQRGGLEAGRLLAEACMAGLAQVRIVASPPAVLDGPAVTVVTDQPVAACMAAQYAGWQVSGDGYFAMGSGPMRAAAGKEPLFDTIGHRESPSGVVGILESGKLPPDSVVERIASDCRVEADGLTLLVARTASLAGTVQVVARSVETSLHKLHELGFDLGQVVSGFGVAPLPPVAADDLAAIGRTNDAVLYGGDVTLWVDAEDEQLERIGPRVPSCASADFGQPFGVLFEKYDRDFYRIDPLLFSPARVVLVNLRSGRQHAFGELRPDILHESFAAE